VNKRIRLLQNLLKSLNFDLGFHHESNNLFERIHERITTNSFIAGSTLNLVRSALQTADGSQFEVESHLDLHAVFAAILSYSPDQRRRRHREVSQECL
jgi:hypothetical protein